MATLETLQDKVRSLQDEMLRWAVVDLFSKPHVWWLAVCRFHGSSDTEMWSVRGLPLKGEVLSRWNAALLREERAKILSNVDATSMQFHVNTNQCISGLIHMKDKLNFTGAAAWFSLSPSPGDFGVAEAQRRALVRGGDKRPLQAKSSWMAPGRVFRSCGI